MEDQDYYDVLQIKKDASESDIKKSYYKLAREYHPDKAPDDKKEEYTKKFQKIGEAYETLSDKEKREIYDQYGKEGLKQQGGGHPGGNPFDIFNDIFGGGNPFGNSGNPFGNMGNRGRSNQKRKSRESVFPLNLTLQDVYKGVTKKLKVTKNVILKNNTKEKVETKDLESTWSTCNLCKGCGTVTEIRQFGQMIQQTQKACDKCSANGVILKEGYIVGEVSEVLEVVIPKGAKDGHQFHMENNGNCSPGTFPGDIIIILQIKDKQNGFSRSGNDLAYTQKILLSEALCGCAFKITTLDNRILYITHSGIIKPGDYKIIKKEGINGADLKIYFDIVFPNDSLNKHEKKELLKILPKLEMKVSKDISDIEYQL